VVSGASERLKRLLLEIQEYTLLSYRAFTHIFTRPRYIQDTFDQMDTIGVGSLAIVCLTGLFTGMVLTVQSSATLDAFGARPYVGRMVSLSMIRELGPVLTSLMVAGRVGSGMAAELGSMVVTEQIEAMRALGTDPLRKLVTPRMVGAILMVPVLTVLSDAVGMLGGFVVARYTLRLSTDFYWHSAVDAIRVHDLVMGLVKPVVFGYIVASVSCYLGLSTKGGTQGVGVSTTRAVVYASVLILAADYFLNLLILRFVYP
jgi:phospholipid/cholesterol/gamma-HCH transport system permease protein